MVVKIKDRALHKRIFKKMNEHDKKALELYKKGKTGMAKAHERLSDKLYKKYYYKMFKVTKN